MRYAFALGALCLVACVGGDDSTTPKDGGGSDATVDSPIANDAAQDQSNPIDAAPDVDKGPPIDGGFAFAAHWGTNSTLEGAGSIAVNPTGGYVVSGSYTGANVNIGSAFTLPTPTGGRDGFVITLDAAGKVTGAIGFGGSGNDDATTVTADANGDIYVAGFAPSGITINGTTLAAGTFLAKLNGKNITAAPLWAKSFAVTLSCSTCLVTRGGDLVFATTFGKFAAQTVNFGPGNMTTHGGYDIALAKFDASTGNGLWQGQIGGTNDDMPGGLALDASRNVYFVGTFAGTSLQSGDALGSKVPTGPSSNVNVLVAKLDSSATPVPQWALAYGDPGGTGVGAGGIAVDGAGHVAVAGSFNGGVDFGMGKTGSSNTDGFVFVLDDSNQKTIWQQVIGDVGTDRANSVAFDAWGHVIVGGTYFDSPQIGSAHLPDAGTTASGSFIAKFGPPPTYGGEWGVGFPQLAQTNVSISATSLSVAPSGVSVLAGGYGGTTDFGAGSAPAISTTGTFESFIAGRNP